MKNKCLTGKKNEKDTYPKSTANIEKMGEDCPQKKKAAEAALSGGPTWDRTRDPLIMSQML